MRKDISKGLVLGTALGIVTKNINLWIAVGLLLSAALISHENNKNGKDNNGC